MIAAIREFLVKVIAPLVWRFMYDNKDDFIRYARVVFRAKIGDLLHVAQKKIGLSPLASKIIKNAVLDFDEEIIIAGSGVKEFPRINTKAIHTIDQGMNVYTLYACVPTSLYLNWCRHTLSTPNWKEYIEILNHLEDIGVWVPGEGANTDRTAIAMEEYLNGKYPEKQVAIEKAYRMDKTLKEGWDKWYIGTVTHKNNKYFTQDRVKDRVIDKDKYAGTSRWGHVERGGKGKTLDPSEVKVVDKKGIRDYKFDNDLVAWNDTDTVIIDNYPDKSKFNNFFIHNRLEAHMKNGLFSSSIHFFVPLFDVEELQKEEKKKEESKPKSFDSFQYALDNGITNDRNPSQAKRETVMMLSRVHKEVTEKNVSIEKAIRVLVEEINKLKKKK